MVASLERHEGSSKKRTTIATECVDIVHPAIVIGWLLKVLEHGVLDLDLYISSVQGYPLPSEMFVSETLVRLKLEVRNVLTIDEALEELVLDNVFEFGGSFSVSHNTLKRLVSLVRLRESGTDEFTIIDVVEVSLSLPKLKTLHMNDVGFADESGAAFAKLVSSCHALEELVMDKIMWDFRGSCSDSNSSLKRVTIYSENIDDEDPKSVSLSALPISSL
ncbi:hypothetical protein Bca52824_077784 [Brassica carinata]|uniref:F-box/LRR-repeat protein 15/At3g58940/PEG3-like LRR domain-containing protein n=1 Tax=Brassica carinata TaxID=52824 RepID=A0A8X7PWJ4_BRACI|nr:hypothetical protein Bca52824_077784 [Brassica carinata]